MVETTIDTGHRKGRMEALHPEKKGGLRGLTQNQYVLWTAVFASIGGFLCLSPFPLNRYIHLANPLQSATTKVSCPTY
jgi:hypothetical protein